MLGSGGARALLTWAQRPPGWAAWGPLLRQERGGTHIPAPGWSLARWWLESQALGTDGTWTGRERREGQGMPKLLLLPEAGTPVAH